MILPSFIIISLLPILIASFILCVIIIVVRLSLSTIFSVRSRTFFAVFGSSAAVCSSRSKIFGFLSVAISRVTACLWPPESNPTFDVSLVSRPKSRLLSTSIYSSFSFLVTPNFNPLCCPLLLASARFSRICISAAVPFIGSWKTLPIYLALLCSGSFVTSIPSTVIVPQSTG